MAQSLLPSVQFRVIPWLISLLSAAIVSGQRQRVRAALEEFLHVGVFVDGVDVVLTGAERDGGNAVAHEPVGVETTVGRLERRLPAETRGDGLGGLDDFAAFLDVIRVVITKACEF